MICYFKQLQEEEVVLPLVEEVEGVVEEDEEGEGDNHIIRQTKTSCGLKTSLSSMYLSKGRELRNVNIIQQLVCIYSQMKTSFSQVPCDW